MVSMCGMSGITSWNTFSALPNRRAYTSSRASENSTVDGPVKPTLVWDRSSFVYRWMTDPPADTSCFEVFLSDDPNIVPSFRSLWRKIKTVDAHRPRERRGSRLVSRPVVETEEQRRLGADPGSGHKFSSLLVVER